MMRLSVCLFVLFFSQNIFAQTPLATTPFQQKVEPSDIGFCANHPAHEMLATQPAYRQMHEQIEEQIYQYFQDENWGLNAMESASPPPYSLPVVVHVIHDGGAENIPDATVLQGIQDLNDAYANIGYYNPATGVNTQIQFCLAKRDPDGNATTGINRVQTPLTEMVLETDDITVKDLSRWNPLEYINIWLVREICSSGFGCGVAGYAYFPTSHGQPEDGIMMEAEYFGSSQGASGVQVHEMGHYLGLYHTFQDGCGNNDCLADGDRVCDTPPDQSTAWLPCGTTANSCSTDTQSGFATDQDDLVEDYMDYNDFDCYSMFTQGQSERMHWHIENVRFSLLDSDGCLDPCTSQLTALFSSSSTNLVVGGTVNFTNSSMNTTTADWEIDGVVFSNNMNADYTFNSAGTFEICLNVGNDDPNCSDVFCEIITVTCPVQSEFTTGVFYPAPGEVVSYTNGSTNATEYEWTVDGIPVGNSPNLDWSFADEAIYDLCLTAGNGLCTDDFCIQVFVVEGGAVGECDTTFLKTYGTLQDDEVSHAIAIVPQSLGGGFLLGGGKADSAMITWVDEVGDIIWTRSFDATPFAEDFIWDIKFDSEDMVIGVGNTKNEPDGNTECFAFRYDMAANIMQWVNELNLFDPAHENYYSILEKTPGGNFVVSGQTNDLLTGGTGCDGILVELNRNTGANVWQQNMHFGSCETFTKIISANGSIYATGRYNFDGGGTARMRPGITRFDFSGNQMWSRWYLEDITFSDDARLYGWDILDDNGLVVFGHGDPDGTSATDNELFIFRTDYDGNIEWARHFDIPGSSTERATRLINLPDGYLCLGRHLSPDSDGFIFKTDKDGNLIWSKNYGEAGGEEEAWDMLWQAGQIYFTGKTDVPSGGLSEDVFLANIAADGSTTAQDSCNLFTELDMTEADWQDPYDGQHDLENLNQNWSQFLNPAIMGETAVQSTVECFIPCLDSCDLVPEALFEGASAICGGDGLDLELIVCNTGNFDFPAGTPVTIYDADPTTGSASVVATIPLDVAVGDGECETFTLTFTGMPNATYFVLINDDGTSVTPIDLATYEGLEEECDYTNNLGSFFYDFMAPTLDLGPDISSCDNQAVTLDAGSGFAEYKWSDNSEMQTLTAIFPGTYSVTVTDECGGTQSDEIIITVDPATELDMGPDQDLCQGGTIEYDLGSFFFESYEWTPTDGVTCLNPECTQVEISPSEDITYTVVATNADGCFSTDSFSVTILEAIEIIDDVAICEGDTVMVFGEPIFETGEYSMTFTAVNGCDSIYTISVGVLDTTVTEESIFTCFGVPVDIFGAPTSTAGVYEMTFENELGCDSTHIITLAVGDELSIGFDQNDITCFGGTDGSLTANPSGGSAPYTYEWENGDTDPMRSGLSADTYSVTVTDASGCTAEASVTLSQPDEIIVSAIGQNVSCTELGTASVSATGGTGDFTYEWSTGETTANISDLEAGIYEVTATDEDDCTATASVEITGALGPAVSISIDALPSELDPASGALTALQSGGTAPFVFDWSNGEIGASQTGLESGEYTVTVTDANDCTAEATVQIYIPACTGGKIWNDADRDGCQDGGEFGMEGIELELNGTDIWGNVITMTTTSAFNGEYIFEPLPPGDYQVTLPLPTGYLYSPVDACSDDFTDSDFDGSGVSYTVNLVEGHCCLVVDGGLYDACFNVYDPGEICCDQVLCGPGLDPAPISSVSPAVGGAPIEYMWMYTHEMGAGGISYSNGQWAGIPGTNSPSYDPGPIQQTTYYARCVRAVGCNEWLETNVVEVFVDDVAVAEMTTPPFVCVGNTVTFEAADNPAGATYSWNFGPTATPSTSTSQNPTVVFTESGYPNITLTVIYNDCTSSDSELIAVSDDPVYCGTAIQAPANGAITATGFSLFPNPATDFVTLRWSEAFDTSLSIELMGIDGRQLHTANADGMAQFHQTDLSRLVPGVYVLRVKYGDGESEVFRVVKE